MLILKVRKSDAVAVGIVAADTCLDAEHIRVALPLAIMLEIVAESAEGETPAQRWLKKNTCVGVS